MFHYKIELVTLTDCKFAFIISDATSTTENGIGAMGSSSSVRSRQFLENSVNWAPIIKKYRNLKIETPED